MSEIPFTTNSPVHSRRGPARRRRALRALSSTLIVLGVLALLDVGVTLVWQEPFSALYAKLQQDQLRGTLRTLEHAKPTARENARLLELVDERRRISFLASELARHASLGSAVGSIRIPRIGADFVLVYGTGTEELEQGPGIYTQSIYPGTRFPGLRGTTAIAGHRTTFLAPFRHIDELRRGDRILVNMPYAHFVYTVIDQRSVLPTDVYAAIRHAPYSRLVLSACTPPFSAAERLLVYARLTKTTPVGAALPRRRLTRRSPPPALRAPLPRLQA